MSDMKSPAGWAWDARRRRLLLLLPLHVGPATQVGTKTRWQLLVK